MKTYSQKLIEDKIERRQKIIEGFMGVVFIPYKVVKGLMPFFVFLIALNVLEGDLSAKIIYVVLFSSIIYLWWTMVLEKKDGF